MNIYPGSDGDMAKERRKAAAAQELIAATDTARLLARTGRLTQADADRINLANKAYDEAKKS